jgi:hypothetical protein
MSEPFLRVLFPGQARICGRQLPPLTLWRIACLQAIRSPFLSVEAETGTFTLADLLLALRAVQARNMTPPNLRPHWRDVITLVLCRKSARYRQKHGSHFLQWLALHQLSPELWKNEDNDGRSLSAPFIISQIAALMETGMSHAEAWDTAPGYATWLLAASAERHTDRVQFTTEEDAAINEITAALDLQTEAEILAQAKANLPPAVFDRWVAARQSTLTA